jgi:hypothetical protein
LSLDTNTWFESEEKIILSETWWEHFNTTLTLMKDL